MTVIRGQDHGCCLRLCAVLLFPLKALAEIQDHGCCLRQCAVLLFPLKALAEIQDEVSAVQVSLQAPASHIGLPAKGPVSQPPRTETGDVEEDLNEVLVTQETICSAGLDKYGDVCRWMRSHAKRAEIVTDPVFSNSSPEARQVLHSPTHAIINVEVLCMLVLLLVCTLAGLYAGSNYWVVCLCLSSYALLVPGLFVKDFSYNVAINLPNMGMADMLGLKSRIQVTQAHGRIGPVRESTRSFIVVLWQANCKIGAVLIAICAFVVPLMKLVLLASGEWWRASRPKLARHCIQLAQVTSKWAAPDIFTFAVLYTSLRHMHHPPLVESLQIMEAGFSCYSCFCVGSVLATCCIPLPVVEDDQASGSQSLLLRFFEPRSVFLVALLAASVWAPLFLVGLFLPVMRLHMDTPVLLDYFAHGVNPQLVQTVMKLLNIDLDAMMNSQASIVSSTIESFGWFFRSGDLCLLVMAVMLSIFVIALTVCSVFSILRVAFQMGRDSRAGVGATKVPFLLRHLCLTDVCCMGVIIGIVSSRNYRAKGLLIDPSIGLYFLIISEVLHWSMHNLVLGAAEHAVHAEEKKVVGAAEQTVHAEGKKI